MRNVKPHHVISLLAAGGIAFAALNFQNQPLFSSLDQFVLFAEEEIKLEQGVQVSSGDLGANGKLGIQKEAIINGNLFADRITIDKDSQINGNASYNKLDIKKESRILGTQIKPVQLPVALLPEIPDFAVGTQDFKFVGQNNALTAGNYRDVTIEKDGRLTLSGGAYNLRKLELKENSTLIFSAPAIANIKEELKAQQNVSFLPAANSLTPQDLEIRYADKKSIEFGKRSFLNFKLMAPEASVHIGEETTLRGQVLARKVRVGKGGVVSREVAMFREFDPTKVIIDSEKSIYPTNEVIVNFTSDATVVDAQAIANFVNGIIVGYIDFANAYQFQVSAAAEPELDAVITKIKSLNNPKVEGIFPNFIRSIETL